MPKDKRKIESLSEFARLGGSAKTPKKTEAVRKNGRLGGRPPKPDEALTDLQRKRRVRDAARAAANKNKISKEE